MVRLNPKGFSASGIWSELAEVRFHLKHGVPKSGAALRGPGHGPSYVCSLVYDIIHTR